MLWRIISFWDWFWFYRRGKIRYRVWDLGFECRASASNGKFTVWNCYGSTPDQAIEVAKFRMKKALEEDLRD
ncbi:hypothetical protein V7152_15040 [Neobacillus drentensis]|uniref:hypothetical protein n=1 Tax=Neobacillus drentensis TaxID=220684 RepID=UPI002FFFB6B8